MCQALVIRPMWLQAWGTLPELLAGRRVDLLGRQPDVLRGLLGAPGLSGRAATAPVVFWPAREIAIDAWHHTVYAVATGVAYEALSQG